MKQISTFLYSLTGLAVLLSMSLHVAAQQSLTLDSYNNETEIKSTGNIILKPGFYIPTGKTVRIFIEAVNLAPSVPFAGIASTDQNYIAIRTFKIGGILNDQDVLSSRNTSEVNQSIQYLDGLGRPSQNVVTQGSPGFRDLITPIAYDAYGRETVKYQPYAAQSGTNGSYRPAAITEQGAYFQLPDAGVKATSSPFSVSVFESSPLNRLIEQGAPGASWQPSGGHTVRSDYTVNIAGEVKLWIVNGAGADGSTDYPAGKLYKNVTKDENWTNGKTGTIEEFTDLEGHVVLKRIWQDEVKSLSTYYIYDDLGNLRYVLPPSVNQNGNNPVSSFTESDAVYDQFMYGYHYDGRKRVIEKKLPGKGIEEFIYSRLDLVVFSQDANQKTRQERAFIKYDALGRVILSGVISGQTQSRADLQAAVDGQTYQWEIKESPGYYGYSNRVSNPGTISAMKVDIVNYYDDYNFPDNTFGLPDATKGQVDQPKTKGLPTATKTAVLGTNNMLLSVQYYDEKWRVTETKSQNHLGGTDVVDNTWNFANELIASMHIHTVGSAKTTIALRYNYDGQGRKIATFESINDQPEVLLAKVDYNEAGQLKGKNLHSTDGGNSFLQKIDYSYNERGWLKEVVSPQFSESLNYDDGTVPQWNGNIAGQSWGTGSNFPNVFRYNYDRLNRLTSAISTGVTMSESMAYDAVGNISQLTRDGQSGNYSYTGNRLNQIDGALATGAYSYDANGNVTKDGRNGITLDYNYLNLPQTATKAGLNMTYTYDATGNKLRKVSNGTTTDYIGSIQYAGSAIDFIQTEEGLARNNSGTYSYEYNLSDHLGNVRASIYKNPVTGNLETLQKDDYYAFGLRRIAKAGSNKYLYNKKELQDELGQYDYGARFYDPVVARWNVVDPLAEMDRRTSPYAYGFDDPIRHTDPDGMYGEDVNDGEGDPPVRRYSLARDPNGDQVGIIRNATVELKRQNPVKAFFVDFAHDVLDGTGFNAIDNALNSEGKLGASEKIVLGITILQALDLPASEGKSGRTSAYEVGSFSELKSRSVSGDGLDIHHAPQKQQAGQVIEGYNQNTAPSIAIPKNEHVKIPTRRGAASGDARSQLAKDIRDLRNKTDAPVTSLQQLIEFNKKMYPELIKKK